MILHLTRPLLLFDLESTGPRYESDRIVEIAFLQLKPDGTTREWKSLVDPQISIPKESTEKHGIDDARIRACARCATAEAEHPRSAEVCEAFTPVPTFAALAPHLLRGFKDCDYAGYNIKTFDLPLLQAEFARAGHTWSYEGARLIDGYRLWQVAEPRTLSDFVERWTGQKLEGAHQAGNDIAGTLAGLLGLLKECQSLPRDLDLLHEAQWPPKKRQPDWIDADGKIVWKNGVATFNFGKKYRDLPVHKATRRDLEWLASPETQFSQEFKAIVRDALAGKLPSPPKSEAA